MARGQRVICVMIGLPTVCTGDLYFDWPGYPAYKGARELGRGERERTLDGERAPRRRRERTPPRERAHLRERERTSERERAHLVMVWLLRGCTAAAARPPRAGFAVSSRLLHNKGSAKTTSVRV